MKKILINSIFATTICLVNVSLSNAQPVSGWVQYWPCNNPYNVGWAPPEIVDGMVKQGIACVASPIDTSHVYQYYELGKYYRDKYNQAVRVLAETSVYGIEVWVIEQMSCNGGLVGRMRYHNKSLNRPASDEIDPVSYDNRCQPLQNSLAWEYFYGR